MKFYLVILKHAMLMICMIYEKVLDLYKIGHQESQLTKLTKNSIYHAQILIKGKFDSH